MAKPIYYIDKSDPDYLEKKERFFNAGFKVVIFEQGKGKNIEQAFYEILCNHLH